MGKSDVLVCIARQLALMSDDKFSTEGICET